MFIVSKLNYSLNVSNSARKSIKDGVDIGTVLHADDSELVFFVDPHKESFVLVVEDTTTVWPVTVKVAGLEETISFPIANCCWDKFFFYVTVKILKKDSVTYLKRKWSSMSCLR